MPRGHRENLVLLPTPSVTLVLAIGNPLCADDGAGLAVLESLEQSHSIPETACLFSHPGAGLLDLLLTEHYEKVIIIDAALMGYSPGEWKRFSLKEATPEENQSHDLASLHEAGLIETIKLASAMGISLPEVTIFGVQPGSLEQSPGLSVPVKEAVPAITAAILEEINSMRRCLK
jgi:hydrogenase maturation protease